MKSAIPWDKEAEKALRRAPVFVRGMVRRKVEERVSRGGGSRVTLADFREAEARFRAVMGGKSRDELQGMMPQPNRPGAEMVALEVCHNELSGCPNPLINTSEWKEAVEKWAKEKNLSERLRSRIKEDNILYHHKLRISISGCPNGCSRPQIADIGIVGSVRPDVAPALCAHCGACAGVCPDAAIRVNGTAGGAPPVFDREKCQGCLKCRDICPAAAISLSPAGVRMLAGGRLGRHPRLAEVYGEFNEKTEALEVLTGLVDVYIENAGPDERFADFTARTKR